MILFRSGDTTIVYDYRKDGQVYGHIETEDGDKFPPQLVASILNRGYWDFVADPPAIKAADADITKGVPGPAEVERALSRLTILPNPAHPDLQTMQSENKYVESPWAVVEVPTVDPNVWDRAELALIPMDELHATDPYMRRKNIRKHIKNMGQSIMPYRSNALVVVKDGVSIIIDGHHRLFARWLLGQDTAPVWRVEI